MTFHPGAIIQILLLTLPQEPECLFLDGIQQTSSQALRSDLFKGSVQTVVDIGLLAGSVWLEFLSFRIGISFPNNW